MFESRVKLLLIIGGLFFVGILLIPDAPTMRPSRLLKKLPAQFGIWEGKPREPGQREKKILAKDTEFERMSYSSSNYGKVPLEVSLVFSGKNVNQSIHRPEVCLEAQGWQFVKERDVVFDGVLGSEEALPLREITCRFPLHQQEAEDARREPILTKDGEQAYSWRIFYYTFFGYEKITSGHYDRTFADMSSRIMGGYDQRWAYATFSVPVTKEHADQGLRIDPTIDLLDFRGAQKHVRNFLSELLPIMVTPPREGVDATLEQISKNLK